MKNKIFLNRDGRFEFGNNWKGFLSVVSSDRIIEAQNSLKNMLGTEDLSGKSFLDIGSGSGLFSLAARKLGAKVYSFDRDEMSVECTRELKERFFPGDKNWHIERGDVLNKSYLECLGEFDIVYSWGVLHHTGAMWDALRNVLLSLKHNGCLYIAIYNDQGIKSNLWKMVKKFYCSSFLGKFTVLCIFIPCFMLAGMIKDIVSFKNPFKRYLGYKKNRGMSIVHDWVDWLGGYPFEVAKPEKIVHFYEKLGLTKAFMKTCKKKLGCNEFLFIKNGD